MKLLDVIRDGSCLLLITDQGELKNSWSGNYELEQKARLLVGKKIQHETWGGFDQSKWFSDLWDVTDDGFGSEELITESDGVKRSQGAQGSDDLMGLDIDAPIIGLGDPQDDYRLNFRYGIEYDCQTSVRLVGPPGTGKTTTLINLVKEQMKGGVESKDIAFIAFTNVAADEAIKRIQEEFQGKDEDFSNFSTLHSLATRCGGNLGRSLVGVDEFRAFDKSIVLQEEWIKVGDAASAVYRHKHPVLDAESLRINTGSDCLDFSTVQGSVRDSLENFYGKKITTQQELISKIKSYLASYKKFKDDNFLADFNDVVKNVVSDEFPQTNIPCFDFLIVDEAQDLSSLQWKFVHRLAKNAGRVVVAGDDDQAIMESFGASPRHFVEFPTTEPDIALNRSYRLSITMKDWLDGGVIPALVRSQPNRLEKNWEGGGSEKNHGRIINREQVEKEVDGEIRLVNQDIDVDRLLRIIKSRSTEEWLVMAPTRATCHEFSRGLAALGIAHFHQRKDVLGNSNRIYVQTIHTSKGMDVDNAALVVSSVGDNFMLNNDIRLLYVAVTRAKTELYPLVRGDVVKLDAEMILSLDVSDERK